MYIAAVYMRAMHAVHVNLGVTVCTHPICPLTVRQSYVLTMSALLALYLL